jgi:hypothetical protein
MIAAKEKRQRMDKDLNNLLPQKALAREKAFLSDQESKWWKAELKNFVDLASSDYE